MSKTSRAFSFLLVSASLLGCDKGPTKSGEPKPVTASAPAATPPGATATTPASDGTSYGAGVKLAAATPIDAILADPKSFHGKTVRVEGMVTDVCPKRGCWFDLAGSAPGQKLRFKVTDGEMVFPVDAKGLRAVAEGVVNVKDLTLEETKAHAEYQAKEYGTPYDPASITEPTSIVRIDGTGAVFDDKK
jgi:hypothetical protein